MAVGILARFGRSVKAVGWSFLGIRSKAGHEDDLAGLKPLEVVAVGLIGVFVLIGVLVTVVNWAVSK
jgi:predicted Na+-dependent transporter